MEKSKRSIERLIAALRVAASDRQRWGSKPSSSSPRHHPFSGLGYGVQCRNFDNFAKLAYLRVLQRCPLSNFSGESLLVYHHAVADIVSKSLWRDHATGDIRFELIGGSHDDWEAGIHHTIPLVWQQLKILDRAQDERCESLMKMP